MKNYLNGYENKDNTGYIKTKGCIFEVWKHSKAAVSYKFLQLKLSQNTAVIWKAKTVYLTASVVTPLLTWTHSFLREKANTWW